jgi:hypothetical protein
MNFILGAEYIVTMRPDSSAGLWQKLETTEDGTLVLSSGPATIHTSDALLIRPSLSQSAVSGPQEAAFWKSFRGLPEWTRTDIALDLDIEGRDVGEIHVFRCREGGK